MEFDKSSLKGLSQIRFCNSPLSFFHQGSNGKAVLLIHGLTGSPTEMSYLGKKLHRAGFTVYAPLLAGHGNGVKELLQTKWQNWYQSVEQAYLDLRKSFQKIYVAGICAGGSLGLKLASEYSEISGLVLYSITFRYDGWNMPHHYCIYYALAPLKSILQYIPIIRSINFVETEPFGLKDKKLRQMVQSGNAIIEGALDSFPILALSQMYDLNKNIKKILPQITTPTLLIHAKEDDMSHPRNAEYVAKQIGDKCQIHWLENSYHMVHIDQERHKVAALTIDFFQNPVF